MHLRQDPIKGGTRRSLPCLDQIVSGLDVRPDDRANRLKRLVHAGAVVAVDAARLATCHHTAQDRERLQHALGMSGGFARLHPRSQLDALTHHRLRFRGACHRPANRRDSPACGPTQARLLGLLSPVVSARHRLRSATQRPLRGTHADPAETRHPGCRRSGRHQRCGCAHLTEKLPEPRPHRVRAAHRISLILL